MKKRIIFSIPRALLFFSFTFLNIVSGPSGAVSDTGFRARKDQIKVIESKLSRERQKLRAVGSQERGLLDQLADLEQEVAKKRQTIEELSRKIRLAKTAAGKLKHKLAELERLRKNTEIEVAKRLVVLYKYARKGYVKILANVSTLDELWHRTKYLKAIMKEDRKALARLAEEELRHKDEIKRIKEQIVEQESIGNEEKKRLSYLRKDLEKKVIRLMKIHKEKGFYETAVKELQLAAQNLKQTLLNIEKKAPYKIPRFSQFAESKGKLPFPIEGKIIKGGKLLWSERPNFNKGVFVGGSGDTKVKAVFPGRVDFSGRLKGYGDVIIVNHGSRFFTVSANLSQRIMQEGDVVERGEVIGLVGGNGFSKELGLYFEIRRAGENLDPLEWLKRR